MLIAFANILKKYESNDNHFYRIGGDEFVGLFFEPKTEILRIVKNISEDVSHIHISKPLNTITVSVGIVRGEMRESLLQKADLLLYTAKQNGKNQYIYDDESHIIIKN